VNLTTLAALPAGKDPPVPIGQEAGWAPEPVSTMWKVGKSRKLLESVYPAAWRTLPDRKQTPRFLRL
jgi:hypothetical protein